MKELVRASAVALGVWVAGGAAAAEPYVLYENFSSPVLDPARWLESERSRIVTSNSLRLVERDWGSTASDAGNSAFIWSESLTRGGPVTQLRAALRVTAIDMTACAANPTQTVVRARIMGAFFNTGNRSAGSSVGDVLALLHAVRASNSPDPPGVLRVEGVVSQCASSDCLSGPLIGAVSLGTVNVGTPVLMQVDWDRPNKQFLFSRDKGMAIPVAYAGFDDSADPGNPFKSVGTRIFVANCASGPRAFGFIDTRFDNVQVNTTAKP